uniref:Cadherin domain-containing protein n=1 Tax=Globisporangium ultimum (strain ATCC 200006 / CBS 805.95 / DAOM BR144) TaxID=431595 RepID=K3XCC1_GLOUD
MVYYPPPNWNYETGAGRGHVVEWLFSVARGDIVHETYADVVIVPRPDSPVIQVPSWVEHPNWSMGDFLSKFRSSCNPIVCDEDSPVLLRGLTVRSADSGDTPSAKSQALFRVSLSVSHGVLTFADKRCITRLFDSSIATSQRRFEFEADVGCINVVLAATSYTGDPNFSGSDTLSVEVVNVETTLSDQVAVPLTVIEINDAPYLVSSEFYDCDEDIPLIIQNIRVVDPDLPVSGTITIGIRAAFGSLALLHPSGVTVTPKSSAAAGFVMQGTLQSINTALASLVYTSGNDWNSVDSTFNSESDGFDTITFQLSDSQSFNSSMTSIRYMYVRPRADPVVISVPQNLPTSNHTDERQGSIHGDEDAWIQVHDLSFASVDDMAKITLQVSLSATSGVLELFTTSGITFLDETRNKRKLFTFKGTFANVNRSVSALRYLPDPNFYGVDQIAITATTVDEYTREESQETTATILVRIDAVNDPPVWDASSADNVVVEPKSPTLIRGVHFEDVDITDAKPGYIALEGSLDHLNFVLHDMVFEFEDIEATQQVFLDLNDIGLTLTVDDRGTFGIGGPR